MITNSVAFGDLDNQQLKYKFLEYYGDGTRSAFSLPLFPIYSIDTVLVDDQPYNAYCYDPVSGWISLASNHKQVLLLKFRIVTLLKETSPHQNG